MNLYIPPTSFPRFEGSSQGNILNRLVLHSPAYEPYPDPPKFSMKSEPRPTDLTLLGVGLPRVVIIWNNLTVASVSKIDVGDCVELIRRAPVLHTLRMRAIQCPISGIFPLPNTKVVHPHLRSLVIEQFNHRPFIGFLDSVSFPSLEQWSHNH